jgi:ankyrin repeat protein
MITLRKALQYGADVNTTAPIKCPSFPDGFELRVSRPLWLPSYINTTKKEQSLPVEKLTTPLMLAAGAGYTEVVETLLQHGARVNVAGGSGVTPLMAAAGAGHTRVMEILLAAGADDTVKGDAEYTALDLAAAAAVSLLLQFDADRSPIPWDEALILAATQGHIEVLRVFLDAGADPTAEYNGYRGCMPLIFNAIEGDNAGIVELLLSLGEDPDRRHESGLTPLIFAVMMGSREICEVLLRWDADVHAVDNHGHSALFWAREYIFEEIEELLKKAITRFLP